MLDQIKFWYQRNFSDPQAVILAILLLVGLLAVLLLGQMLAPVLASVIIAYLLEGVVIRLERLRVPRILGVLVVFLLFLATLLLLLFGIMPMVTQQLARVVQTLPSYMSELEAMLASLVEPYSEIVPEVDSEQQVSRLIDSLGSELVRYGSALVSVSGVMNLLALLIFLVLMPILVFFFLKDKNLIMRWVTSYLPKERDLATSVWQEVDAQIGNYVRGKVLEILIVWIVTFIVFTLFDLEFAMLLSMLVGFSVLIPYIGAAVVTVPVALVALAQFGPSAEFAWVVVAYVIIQALDGNVLVPVLFSEAVSLHPVAIIVAVLVFGGIWGFWGVFFAIPLATLVNAVLRAWPRRQDEAARNGESAPATS